VEHDLRSRGKALATILAVRELHRGRLRVIIETPPISPVFRRATAAVEVGLSYECIRIADARRTGILSDWEAWLRRADQLYERFTDRLEGDSPFDYHEVASVGFLSNAAAMAGYLPMNEYDVFKRGRSDKRTKVPGRADLWFDTGPRCYSFEFKRTRRPATIGYLRQRLEQAFSDVNCVARDESHYAAACLLTGARSSPYRDLSSFCCQRNDRCRLYNRPSR
jgi:hypothetical protein